MSEPTRRLTLSDLPFAARLTVAAFLISVGVGYFSALVQLHVQHASPGQMLPGDQQLIDTYHGKPSVGALERLITADENLPLTGSGSMRAAFTWRSVDWDDDAFDQRVFLKFAEGLPKDVKDEDKGDQWDKLPQADKDKLIAEVRKEVRAEREGEAAAMLEWIRNGLDKDSYDKDKYTLQKPVPLTKKFQPKGDASAVKIKSLIRSRCVRCHNQGREVEDAPLAEYRHLVSYAKKGAGEPGGVPLRKLAQSTHVHLLGFSMLYGLTGVIFACSSWPGIFRFLIAPLPLVAQLIDISFWWLARLQDPWGPEFARGIRYTGMVVAAGLGLQIILSLFSLFGWFGRFLLVLAIAAALVGAYYVNDQYLGPYLAQQAKLSGL
jgi:hypothetical protein